jgi:peptidoglycan/LPS O-acetylase OafA/YrhL
MPNMVKYISTHSIWLDNGIVVLQLAAVLLVSTLTYKYVEMPGVQLGKRLTRRKGATPGPTLQGTAQ